jgi:hypothetical protein
MTPARWKNDETNSDLPDNRLGKATARDHARSLDRMKMTDRRARVNRVVKSRRRRERSIDYVTNRAIR